MLFEDEIRPNALVRASVDGQEIVGEAVETDGELVVVREFGSESTRRVHRTAVEVK